MLTSKMIRSLCEKMNISISELARRIGQSPQNFNKKLQRGTVSVEEMLLIADVLGIMFEQRFVLPSGEAVVVNTREKEGEMDYGQK
jgi:transcriptional regulator with XRE-family HTH domain